ncbi:OLC1v1017852C1 [Oldenlandia corymbosa var. corymbosa]|uniref:OLC1v1017852C1 n=1 Tax=Oldenlandia corymbosa var. corymbosa TaxID=529605 RepID=A0AAV1EAA9_OLDCO|nr:OLC1v1017852C1 [Oldenlandia corymbosa var. corymbosa]
MQNILAEVDNLSVIKLAENEEAMVGLHRVLIMAIRDLLQRPWSVELKHIYWARNFAVDSLASLAASNVGGLLRLKEPPATVRPWLQHDLVAKLFTLIIKIFSKSHGRVTSEPIMGWLSKIFKGSSHKLSEGKYDRRYDVDYLGNYPSSSWDTTSETEDIDRAIALSLAEEDQKGKHVVDSETQLKEDEQLARALQESLTDESPPKRGNRGSSANESARGMGNLYQPMHYPYSIGFSRICAGCYTEIGHGRFLNCMGAVWHPECFRCHACNQPISDYEFSMYGSYPYHKACYKEHYHPKCDVCKHFIPTNAAGLIEYRAHPFWSQKYCPYHELDGTPRCCSCERMEPRDTKYVALGDGRKLCLECLDSVIMDTSECQPLYLDIQEFYEGLDMKVEQQVPLLLVERQALNEAMDGEKHGHHHMPETRGLCLSEEQTISTVRMRPRTGNGNRVMDVRKEPFKLTRRCEVTAILILYGLPRLLTGSILAHEMMHAWLRLRGYRTLSQDIEEGICQVLAHMWLQSQLQHTSSGDNGASTSSMSSYTSTSSKQRTRSPYERKLGEFFKHQIESDTSPIYGNGFRAANQAVLKYGLERTLDHIRMTGSLPY